MITTLREKAAKYDALQTLAQEMLEALRDITENVWILAKAGFDTNEGHAEQDFAMSDPEGFACWEAATCAIQRAEEALGGRK